MKLDMNICMFILYQTCLFLYETYDYNVDMLEPFISHIIKYFCKTIKNMLIIYLIEQLILFKTISSYNSYSSKGLIYDCLLGDGIFHKQTILQVKNIKGLLVHLLLKLRINCK